MILRAAAAAAAAAVALVAGGCTGGRDALTIYSGREEALVGPLLERFSKAAGIAIDVKYGDSAELALLLAEEGPDTPAHVFFSQSPGAVGFMAERGLLGGLHEDVVDAVPSEYRGDGGRWVGITARQRVLVYNTEMVGEGDLPDSVFDLTAGTYAGRVGVAPSNASFQDFVTAMRQSHGEERTRVWLKEMAGNPVYADNISIVDAVSRGEIPMGLVNHYYNHRFLEADPESPTRNYVFPEGGVSSLVLASTVSVLRGADERAHRFVEFLLSDRAQRYFAEETFEYPLASGTPAPSGLPPLATSPAAAVDIDSLGGGLRKTVRLISESGLL